MTKRILFIFILAIQALAAGSALHAQSGSRSSLESKLALENSLEKRLRMVLSEALGTEDIIVIISAELQEQEKKSAIDIMPGIPEKGNKMGELSLSSTLTMVKKISASLILDKSVSKEDTQLARKLAAGLLGLPPERQDLITIEKMDFRKSQPLSMAGLLAPANLLNLIWIVVVAILAVFMVSSFLSPLSKSARTFVEAFSARNAAAATEQSERPEAAQKETAARTAEVQAREQSPDGRKAPFWFIGPANVANLAFIMRTRSVEDLTILLSYAPEDTAAKLAEALYPRSVEALAALPKVTLMPEARIRALETEILSALDYVVGGEDKAVNIIGGLDESVQEKTLSAFTRLDPALSRRLNSSIVKLSSIKDLEPAQAQTLARRIPMRVLAAALKGSAYAEIFISKLGGGMQERFRQELDLTRAMNPEAYKAERARVVETLRQMIREGLITVKQPGAPTAAAPVQAPGVKAAQPAPTKTAGPAPAPHAAPRTAAAPQPGKAPAAAPKP